MLSEREKRVKSKKQEANKRREKKRTPPEIGFASKENLFSYDKAPVNKSVVVVSNQRERESQKRSTTPTFKKKEKEKRDRALVALAPRAHANQSKKELSRVPLAPFAMSG